MFSIHAIKLLSIAALAVLLGSPAFSADKRPNILLITADDLGCELGCYGDKCASTPNLDGLCRDGVRFDRAFVTSASCSPSRSSIFTGKYPHENGQIGLSHRGFTMHPGQVSFPSLLKRAGYHTGVIGKVHVAPASAVPFDFDTNGKLPGSKTNDIGLVTSYIEKFFAEDFDGPFLLMVNFFDPHHPPEGKNNYIYDQIGGLPEHPLKPNEVEPFPFLKATNARTQSNVAGYYNCVNRLDVGVGRLLDILRREGQEDKTLVIFLGDHGPPFPGGKISCYEAGLRVPFLVRWPGCAKESLVCDEMVSTIDIMPTVLDAVGVEIPDDLRGRSLIPLLKGEAPPWRDVMYGEFNWHTQSTFRPERSVRDERYKLILRLASNGGDQVQLFDLAEDPHEFNNLAGMPEHAANEQRLLKRLDQWRHETNDPLLDRSEIEKQRKKYYQRQ